MAKKDAMLELERQLDSDSYDWMMSEHPELLNVIEHAVTQGVSDMAIKRAVLQQTGRLPLALRCQQVARHVARG